METKNVQSQLQQSVDQADRLLAEFTTQVVTQYRAVTYNELTEQLQAESRALEAKVANTAVTAAQQALNSLYETYAQEKASRLAAQKELNKKLRYLTVALIVLFLMIVVVFILELGFILH